MTQRELQQRISSVFAWHRAFGNAATETQFGLFVSNDAIPDIWDANHVSLVTAASDADIEAVHSQLDLHLANCRHRAATTDLFTPDAFTASLALRGYKERPVTIQMVLYQLNLPATLPEITIEPVKSDGDWAVLKALVRADHDEGARSGGVPFDDDIVDSMVSTYRKKAAIQHFFVARAGSIACAYGSAVCGPENMGMLEDYFTLPSFRGRAIAAALVAHCINYLKQRDYSTIFIGAHAKERAKHLYHRLGFEPVMLTRQWLKSLSSAQTP